MNVDEILKRVLLKIRTGKSTDSIVSDNLVIDFAKANIKYDFIDEGKVLVIHDVPIAKEIVQRYGTQEASNPGMHYKPKDEIENMGIEFSPISLSHPEKHFHQMSDEEVKQLTIGYHSNSFNKDGKKYSNLNLFVDKLPEWFLNNVKDQKAIEVSIGFNHDAVNKPGTFNGVNYDYVQTNIRHDHTAILNPTERARAPFSQGVGIGADKNNKLTEVNNLDEQNIKKLADAENEIKSLKEQSDKTKEEIKTLQDEKKKLEDENKELAKTKKLYDDEKKAAEDAETEAVKKLSDEIIKIDKSDEMADFIKPMDSKQLKTVLDGKKGQSSIKNLFHKDSKTEPKKDIAREAEKARHERLTGTAKPATPGGQ